MLKDKRRGEAPHNDNQLKMQLATTKVTHRNAGRTPFFWGGGLLMVFKIVSSPLQALIAEVMSEAARKSVMAMMLESVMWLMLQPGVICDWRQ